MLFYVANFSGGIRSSDIYIAKRITTDGPWSEPINLGSSLNSPANDEDPFISPDGTIVLFSSSRAGGQGGFDLWQANIFPNPDLNCDGKVDPEDLVILIENWGNGLSHADIAPPPFGDGQVDRKDLDLLLEYMQQDPNKPTE